MLSNKAVNPSDEMQAYLGVYFMQRAILIHITVVFRSIERKLTGNTQYCFEWLFIGPACENR